MDVKSFVKNPMRAIPFLGRRGWFHGIPDEQYLKLLFRTYLGYVPDLENPKTYNEKLQWLKLHDRNPAYPPLADKYAVREYVAEKIGQEHLIPLLWHGTRFEDIDFSALPNQFVIKCTHDSRSTIVCRDKAAFDVEKARKFIEKRLKRNMYWDLREWVYKDIQPRIVIEEFIGGEDSLPDDYKFIAFDGKLDCVFVCRDRHLGHAKYFYHDMNWNRIYRQKVEPVAEKPLEKPENFEEMVHIAEILSQGFAHMRVDLYNLKGKIYFGELTFYNDAGFDVEISRETDEYWGELLCLPQ